MTSLDNTAQSLYCYIDESGTPGASTDTSKYFVMVAIVMSADTSIEINTKLSELRNQLRLGSNSEFKFSRTNKRNIIKVLSMIKPYDFHIYVVCHQKNNKLTTLGGRNVYDNILLKLIDEINTSGLNIEIDGKVGKAHRRQVKTFIRKNSSTTKIKHFRFTDSKSNNLIQLADLVAGSIGRSYTAKPDADIYRELISKHIRKVLEV